MAEKNEKSKNSDSDEQILQVARERYKLAEEAYEEIHKVARDDDKFASGDQWPEEMRIAREKAARPCLTVNRLATSINQVTNDQRQNSPGFKFSPVDDQADVDTAKIYQGLNRHIQSNSNAEQVYDWGFSGAVRRGFGYWRVATDYVSPTSFLQEILVKKIADHYSVRLDPSHNEVDGSDANWGFVGIRVQKDDFIAQYGESNLCKTGNWETYASRLPDWVDEDSCLVTEYFYKDFKREKLLLLSTGESILKSKYDEALDQGLISEGVTIKDQRDTVTSIVKWVKFAGDEILERTEWPCQYIPIIPCYGNMIIVDGQKIFESLIRHAKDPQRMLNLWVSSETETIALAPKAPYVGAFEAFKGFEGQWETANRETHAFLPFNGYDSKGNQLQAPQRNAYEAPVQAITNARMQASEDIKATTGIFDASLGNRSNENSGIAIQRRANQSQTGNFHFVDNLNASIRHTGRIIAELIPVIYDTARTERILGESGDAEMVLINQEFMDQGQLRTYDLSRGKYDVAIDEGPNYATKRQETAASMMEIAKAVPMIMQVAPDLMVENMDWPGASEIAERLKKTVSPNLLDDNKNQQIPPQVQAQMQQMDQMIQQLTQNLNVANEKINTKSMELESKERIEFAKMEVDLLKEQAKVAPNEAMIAILSEVAHINTRLNMIGINEPIDPNQQQNLNGSGFDQAAIQNQQQPTGGFPPGQNVGVQP